MYVWKFDEDKCIFRPAAPATLTADPNGVFVIRRWEGGASSLLFVRESGIERPFPDDGRLNVAGVEFDQDDFIPALPRLSDAELADLRREMRASGLWAKEQLRAKAQARAEAELPLPLPIWISKTPLTPDELRVQRREELRRAVPVHEHEGRPYFVVLDEIPQPYRDQFWSALYGSQCPVFEGFDRCAYAWDWEVWLNGRWYGRQGPQF